MTKTEALQHARSIVAGFKGFAQAEAVLTEAVAAEADVKAAEAKLDLLNKGIDSATKEHAHCIERLAAMQAQEQQERQRIDGAIAAAKSDQQKAEREATEAIARATRAGLDREEQMNKEHSAQVAQINATIAKLERERNELEAAVATLKARFA